MINLKIQKAADHTFAGKYFKICKIKCTLKKKGPGGALYKTVEKN